MVRRGTARAVLGLALTCAVTLTGGVVAALTSDRSTGARDGSGAAPGTPAGAGGPAAPGSPEATEPGSAGGVTNISEGEVAAFKRAVPPDLLAVAGTSIGPAATREITRLRQVREAIVVGGGAVRLGGRKVNAFAVEPSRFRSWTPPGTAKRQDLWAALAADRFVVSESAARTLKLRNGDTYPIAAKTAPQITMGGSGALGLPGVDLLVDQRTGHRIGLVPDLAIMVSAPGADLGALSKRVRAILGDGGVQVINLRESRRQATGGGGRPVGYLDLYRQAAKSCPGLSWTVLAAIGQIESAHGRNAGRSSAGALGPMQFMPATWRAYGVDGDGDRRADIMNPYDAVPSAAKYLCASGAGRGGQSLYDAVFAYNHAHWYVRDVLELAKAYARQYS
ncbi:lytic transglycosylase domain-containing protein [Actinomadura alba]|uniref:Lytic transglycosylase domain-containing protein n=2 Tax=Actinomadura alba TaxID=406431 RepID=A0ABR7LJI8_9ACTN|nr:lytic transglycosylase domain-containing protein [Actinomadura alba]